MAEINVTQAFPQDFDLKENPSYNDVLMIYDADAGKVKQVQMEKVLASSAANIIGSALPTDSPSGTETVGQSYRVGNDTDDEVTYTNFLDKNSAGLVVPAKTSGLIIKNQDGWAFVPNAVDLDGLATTAQLDDVKGGSDKSIKQVDDAIEGTQKNIDSITIKSKNLLDKSKLIAGHWGYSGSVLVFVASVNWLCYELDLSDGDYEGLYFTISGAAEMRDSAARFGYLDENGHTLGSKKGGGNAITTQTTDPLPAGTKKLVINIANAINVAVDPTNNAYSDTAMLNAGQEALPYEAYGVTVNPDKIKDLQQTIDTTATNTVTTALVPINGDINNVNTKLNVLLDDYEIFSRFDGTAAIPLAIPYILQAEGDYLEFVAATGTGVNFNDWLGMFGALGASANTFGFYTDTSIYLRGNVTSEAYTIFDGLPSLGIFRKIKLLVASDNNWELYVDDTLISTKPIASPLKISIIGDAYVNKAKFDLKEVTIHTSTSDLIITDPSKEGDTPPKLIIVKPDDAEDTPNMYVEYNTNGYVTPGSGSSNTTEKLTVYIKRKVKNSYVGIYVAHEYDMSEVVYKDEWRIVRADEFTLTNGVMIKTATDVIFGGESECVYQAINRTYPKADFSGGVHGDETVNEIKIFVDGLPIDLTESFELKPCKECYYIQDSSIHETADKIDGVVTPVAGHPIEAKHSKLTKFIDWGYTTRNILEWMTNAPNFWYYTIFCGGKYNAANGFYKNFQQQSFTGSLDTIYFPNGENDMIYYNEETGAGVTVKGRLIRKSEDQYLCKNFTWDRANDSKDYSQTPDNLSTEVGEIYESEMSISFI